MTRRPLGVLLASLGLLVAMSLSSPVVAGPPTTGDVAHDDGLQWGFDRIGAAQSWSTGRGDGVTIAVVDSGVAATHEDLAANVVVGVACRDTDGDPDACAGDPADDDGHGTHVAGIAAAVAGNDLGIAGVAPDASIMPIKVLHRPCEDCAVAGDAADVAAAVRWATDNGADVVNLSLGSTTSTVFGPGFVDAIRYAWDGGAIPVVAAGNQLVLTADFGDAPAVVVSAVDRDDGSPSYANGVGPARWSLAAPGGESGDTAESCSQSGEPVGILSTFWAAPGDAATYACLSGTSMAAPHVAGALAVLRSAGLDPAQAVTTLLDTAVDIGPPGRDPEFGEGLLDLAAASAAVPAVKAATTPTTDPPPVDLGDAPVAAPPNETSAPQVFVPADEDELPVLPLVAAVAGVLASGVAVVELHRRRLV